MPVAGIIDHPAACALEYPETGSIDGESIAHRFPISDWDNFINHARTDAQYSQRSQGQFKVQCLLLGNGMKGSDSVTCVKTITHCKMANLSLIAGGLLNQPRIGNTRPIH